MDSASQSRLYAGAACRDITPDKSVFLYGYPHVRRYSRGVHDSLLSSALCLRRGDVACMFISNDVIFISKATVQRVRSRITAATGIPARNILISVTHTHSGPVTVDYLSNEADVVVPRVDPAYLSRWEEAMGEAAKDAFDHCRPAEVGFGRADCTGIGSCRRDPNGPRDYSIPVLAIRETGSANAIGLMLVCAMHPTVLHEDSALISGDFPAFARSHLQDHVVGRGCPIIYHCGAAGDQSPRHVTRSNTFEEAQRLGTLLGKSVQQAVATIGYNSVAKLAAAHRLLDLPARTLPDVQTAARQVEKTRKHLDALRTQSAARTAIRTAECDCFGAEETHSLARAAAEGRMDPVLRSCLPAEIQVIQIGSEFFVGWPGEFFVQFALDVRRRFPAASVITLANGDLQGYVVTREAVEGNWYEASNALLKSPEAGDLIVEATLELLAELGCARA